MLSSNEINVIILDPFEDKQWTTGGEKRFRKIQEYLKQRVLNVNVISFSDFPFKVNALNFLQTNIRIFKILKAKYLNKNQSVFIYPNSCTLFTFLAMVLLRIICNIKIIVTVEHFKNLLSPSFKSILARAPWFFANRICLHCAHLIIVVSKSAQIECRKMGVNARKIKIVPNGIDKVFNVTKHNIREKQNGFVDILFIGYCGRIKGLFHLVEAMMVLKRQGQNNFYLHIVGETQKDPIYFNKIQRFIYKNSLNDRIKFYGQMYGNDLECAWDQANIFILPSLWESYGLVIIEAMTRGIPVIATNVGAIPELVTDCVSGLIVPPKDSRALAEAIIKLSTDYSLRNKVIEGGHRISVNILCWEKSCEIFYQQIFTILGAQCNEMKK